MSAAVDVTDAAEAAKPEPAKDPQEIGRTKRIGKI